MESLGIDDLHPRCERHLFKNLPEPPAGEFCELVDVAAQPTGVYEFFDLDPDRLPLIAPAADDDDFV